MNPAQQAQGDVRPDAILTPDQVAGMLQVKCSTVLDWTRQGELPGFNTDDAPQRLFERHPGRFLPLIRSLR